MTPLLRGASVTSYMEKSARKLQDIQFPLMCFRHYDCTEKAMLCEGGWWSRQATKVCA